jgi:hypothetical protein
MAVRQRGRIERGLGPASAGLFHGEFPDVVPRHEQAGRSGGSTAFTVGSTRDLSGASVADAASVSWSRLMPKATNWGCGKTGAPPTLADQEAQPLKRSACRAQFGPLPRAGQRVADAVQFDIYTRIYREGSRLTFDAQSDLAKPLRRHEPCPRGAGNYEPEGPHCPATRQKIQPASARFQSTLPNSYGSRAKFTRFTGHSRPFESLPLADKIALSNAGTSRPRSTCRPEHRLDNGE